MMMLLRKMERRLRFMAKACVARIQCPCQNSVKDTVLSYLRNPDDLPGIRDPCGDLIRRTRPAKGAGGPASRPIPPVDGPARDALQDWVVEGPYRSGLVSRHLALAITSRDISEKAARWKGQYFKRYPAAETNKDGQLSWPELQADRKQTKPE